MNYALLYIISLGQYTTIHIVIPLLIDKSDFQFLAITKTVINVPKSGLWWLCVQVVIEYTYKNAISFLSSENEY